MKILKAKSLDVRDKKPTWYARLILWWTYRNTDIDYKKRWNHCADLLEIKDDNGDVKAVVFEASSKYQVTEFSEWVKKYHIIRECDTIEAFNLSQDDIKFVYVKALGLVGTKYGVRSIAGLVFDDIFKKRTVGVDGPKRLICSEASMRLYQEFFDYDGSEPLDYCDPLERGKYFPMRWLV